MPNATWPPSDPGKPDPRCNPQEDWPRTFLSGVASLEPPRFAQRSLHRINADPCAALAADLLTQLVTSETRHTLLVEMARSCRAAAEICHRPLSKPENVIDEAMGRKWGLIP
jgi:hypothetical protein